jgi:hypothetical protein
MKVNSRQRNYRWWLVAVSCWLLTLNDSAFAKNLTFSPPTVAETGNGKMTNSCSEQDLPTITTQLLRDLPSYANRATQRARRLSRGAEVYSYMLVAGRPEFTPLPLQTGDNNVDVYQSEGVEQVFFTTLERQYLSNKTVESQQFHRLLLTKTNEGWTVVMMFTQSGTYSQGQPVSPPRDSSNSAVAQGVKLWLRDCAAGSVRRR